jgi:uncharacterized protein (DUF2147 family)
MRATVNGKSDPTTKQFMLFAVMLAWSGIVCSQADTPTGLWKTFSDRTGQPESMVRIEERNGEFHGSVVKVLDREEYNPVCERCEGELRNKPIVGMEILRGLRRTQGGYGGGTILDPDEGRIYSCAATLLDEGRRLEIRGYVGVPLLGRSQIWVRAD